MSIKSTALFFILFTMALCTPKETADILKTHIKPFVADLIDLTLSDAQAVKQATANINDILDVELVFDESSPAKQLAGIFNTKNYLANKDLAPAKMDAEAIRSKAAELVDNFPTFEALKSKDANGEAIKAEALKALAQVSETWTETLHNALVYELHTQLEKGAKQFDFVQYEAQTKDLIVKSGEKLKAIQGALNKEYKIKMGDDLMKGLNSFKQEYSRFYNKYLNSIKGLAVYYSSPQALFRKAALYLVNRAAEQALNGHDFLAADNSAATNALVGRVNTLIEALSDLSQNDPEENISILLQNFQVFISNPSDPQLKDKKSFYDILDFFVQNTFLGMLPVTPQEEIKKQLEETLMFKTGAVFKNQNVVDVIEGSYGVAPFRSASKSNADNYREPKLRNFDYLLYLPSSAISEERFRSLIHDYAAICTSDARRIRLSTDLKSLFSTAVIDIADNKAFYIKLYDAVIECAATVDESFLDKSAHEVFDHCIGTAPLEDSGNWYRTYNLLMKFVNLMFTSQDQSFQTTFNQISQTDLAVHEVLNVMKHQVWFRNRMNYLYQKISGDESGAAFGGSDMLTFYSGKSFDAALFYSIELGIVTESKTETKEIKTNKIEINVVKDRLVERAGSPKNGPEEQRAKIVADDIPKGLINEVVTIPNRPEDINHQTPRESIGNTRIQIGERHNLVNEIIGRLPKEHLEALKNGSVDDFINNQDIVVTKDGVETTYVFVKVTRKQSPCHPGKGRKC